jgi:hypothetical protein
MIVDMEGVAFIDSSGINALLGVVERTGIQHRGLVVQNPRPKRGEDHQHPGPGGNARAEVVGFELQGVHGSTQPPPS